MQSEDNVSIIYNFSPSRTDDNVIKHMKINQDHSGDSVAYCLSSRRHFKNIVELVSYYERNDLGENFAG